MGGNGRKRAPLIEDHTAYIVRLATVRQTEFDRDTHGLFFGGRGGALGSNVDSQCRRTFSGKLSGITHLGAMSGILTLGVGLEVAKVSHMM